MKVTIVGGGLVGVLCSIYLSRRGYTVTVFESRLDMRKHAEDGGRSINLALSTRGIRALGEVGLAEAMKANAVPMFGRMIHNRRGELSFQPYGEHDQFINSISRTRLNKALLDEAEKQGVTFHFGHRLQKADLSQSELTLDYDGATIHHQATTIIGADGMFSTVRSAMQEAGQVEYSQEAIEHGYKELHVPADANGGFPLERNALHIWPRESFMLIALPNPDATFTATLFLPFEGENSFAALNTPEQIRAFFVREFPDTIPLMPGLTGEFQHNLTSSLVTVRCFPWYTRNTLLIGDAAHGIVPFYGQGMNAGFEDCRILNQRLDAFEDNWDLACTSFQEERKPDADAIAQLALGNFVEMRDLVGDAGFLLRKRIEAHLHHLFPARWIPLYHMVTFDDHVRYSDAYQIGQKQKEIMDRVMEIPGIASRWTSLNFEEIVSQLS